MISVHYRRYYDKARNPFYGDWYNFFDNGRAFDSLLEAVSAIEEDIKYHPFMAALIKDYDFVNGSIIEKNSLDITFIFKHVEDDKVYNNWEFKFLYIGKDSHSLWRVGLND